MFLVFWTTTSESLLGDIDRCHCVYQVLPGAWPVEADFCFALLCASGVGLLLPAFERKRGEGYRVIALPCVNIALQNGHYVSPATELQ